MRQTDVETQPIADKLRPAECWIASDRFGVPVELEGVRLQQGNTLVKLRA